MTHAKETPLPTFDPTRDGYVVNPDEPTRDQLAIAEMVGRPLNPDTNQPIPSPSDAQRKLVDELLDRLDATSLGYPVATVQALLTEAVVRQHGRTMRSVLRELHLQADAADANGHNGAERALQHHADGDLPRWRACVANAADAASTALALRNARVTGHLA